MKRRYHSFEELFSMVEKTPAYKAEYKRLLRKHGKKSAPPVKAQA